jgi:uncharacterized membrane protein
MSLDVLCLRRPKINYVSPPVCEAIFSGSGIPIIVLEPFGVLGKITGIVVIRDGNTRIVSWPAYPGAICYNVYQQQPDGSYVLIAECIEDPTITLPPGLPIIITPVTPDGEGDVSDPIDINGGGGGGGDCVPFIDDTELDNAASLPSDISRINGIVSGFKTLGPTQRPWRYIDRVASEIRTSRSSGVVTASQSASDLVNTDGASFFVAGDVGKFLSFTSGGVNREIIAFISPVQVQVAVVDTVASSTFSVLGQTLGGTNGTAVVVNGAGHIVGSENDTAENPRTFWFDSDNGEIRDLGDLFTVTPVALNENGVLLYSDGAGGSAFYEPITEVITAIPALTMFDLNKNLLVVGQRVIDLFPFASDFRAVKWQSGITTDINPPEAGVGSGAFSEADIVNEAGLIVGRFLHPFGDTTSRTRVFFNSGGVSSSIGFFHPGTSPSTGWVEAEDLNEAGVLVGGADIDGNDPTGISRGFKWTVGSGIVQLDVLAGQPDSYATGVNEAGFIVGYSGNRAVIWRPGQLIPEDLNNFLPAGSGWILETASAITNDSEVVGTGTFNGDFTTYFLKLCL